MDDQTIALLTLLHTEGLGRVKIKKMIDHFGGPLQIIDAGLDRKKRLLFGKHRVLNWEKDVELAQKEGVELITYAHSNYPKELLQLSDFPLLLYVKGTGLGEPTLSLALIGTRNASPYGLEASERMAKELAQSQVCVISGLARGIDTAAHRGALLGGGKTIAFLGSGFLELYPKENGALAEKIIQNGAVITEYPMQMPAAKGLFPQRNRLISGLSQGVCLIESPLKGGGMLTMELALRQKKPCFALPGRIDWPSFEGNLALIKESKAQLITNSNDLLNHFKLPNKQKEESAPIALTDEERGLLKKMPLEEKTIDELVLLTQLSIMQLNVFLTRLVLKKVVKELPGKIFKKVVHGKSTDHR